MRARIAVSILSLGLALGCSAKPSESQQGAGGESVAIQAPAATTGVLAGPFAASPSPTKVVGDGPPLAVGPITVTINGKAALYTVADDGSISSNGKLFAKVVANRIEDATGKTLWSVRDDGSIVDDTKVEIMRFTPDDDLEVAVPVGDQLRETLREDGSFSLVQGELTHAPALLVTGQTRATKRLAALLAHMATNRFSKPGGRYFLGKPHSADIPAATPPK